MRKTKIVCTLGPSTNSRTEIASLAKAGMDVARLNFSHATPEMHGRVYQTVREVSEAMGRPIGVLQDLPGPKIRIGHLDRGLINLEKGAMVRFVPQDIIGNTNTISLPYPQILKALVPGSEMYLADGLLEMDVTENDGESVLAKVVVGGPLGSHKGVNIPGIDIDLPMDLERDLEFFWYGMELGVDWTAVSFVSKASDATPFRKAAKKNGSKIRLLAKIERRQALANIDEIIEAFDGLLVARGDLGIETPIRDVPIVQKSLIKKCNEAGKPVIVATQMLTSMVSNPRPTRAEVTDVANAIIDGADAVMLSEETAMGKYPSKCVQIMSSTAQSAESYLFSNPANRERRAPVAGSATDAIALSASRLAENLKVPAILTLTATGDTARALSRHRPMVPILTAVTNRASYGQLALSWGVQPFMMPPPVSMDQMISAAVDGAVKTKCVKLKDWIVIIAGVKKGVPGNTSLIKYHRVGDVIWE